MGPAGVWNPLFLPDLSLFPPKGSRVRLRGVCVSEVCAFGSELGWAGHEWEGACAGPGAKPWDGDPASLLICLEDPGPQRGLCWSVPLALLLGAGRPPVDAVVTVVAPAWPCCTQGIDLVISSTSSPSVQSWVGILPPGDICNVYGHFFPSELGWGRHWHVDIVDPQVSGYPNGELLDQKVKGAEGGSPR